MESRAPFANAIVFCNFVRATVVGRGKEVSFETQSLSPPPLSLSSSFDIIADVAGTVIAVIMDDEEVVAAPHFSFGSNLWDNLLSVAAD